MMRIGLFWYDADSKRDLRQKVAQAASRYKEKYGKQPNVCYLHPSALDGSTQPSSLDGVRIAVSSSVLRDHLWIGQDDGA